ncbi:MAG: hypothetical protein AAF501_01250, partial [Pseudomonadota bacterium]
TATMGRANKNPGLDHSHNPVNVAFASAEDTARADDLVEAEPVDSATGQGEAVTQGAQSEVSTDPQRTANVTQRTEADGGDADNDGTLTTSDLTEGSSD